VIILEIKKEEFFEKILKVAAPWRIERIEESASKKEINVYLNFPRGTKFKCPICGNECVLRSSKIRSWRHLDLWEYKTYIHAKVPKIDCCNKTPTILPPWVRENSHFTLLMEDNIIKLAKMSTIVRVAKYLREHDTRIWRVINYWVSKCRGKANFSKVINLGIDETSKKGHRYITNFVNLDTRKVMYVADGKDHKTIKEFIKDFKKHRGIAKNIINVTSDMSLAFEKGITKNLPNAKIIIDKFHVIKHINDAVNKVRIDEAKKNDLLKKPSIYGSKIIAA